MVRARAAQAVAAKLRPFDPLDFACLEHSQQ